MFYYIDILFQINGKVMTFAFLDKQTNIHTLRIMKSWMWSVLVFALTLIVIIFLDLPLWIYLLIVVPILIIVFTIGSITYSFRKSLQIKAVPKSGYDKRIKELNIDTRILENNGFDKWHEFYMKMIPDSVIYVFKKQEESIYLCLYHFGSKRSCDIFTRYNDDYTLTTCNTIDGGMTPRPDKSLLQIITRVSYLEQLEIHRKANTFLMNKGLRYFDIPKQEFNSYFLKCIHEYADHVRRFPFWPVLLIYWTITKRGRVFCKEIERQYQEGLIELPKE